MSICLHAHENLLFLLHGLYGRNSTNSHNVAQAANAVEPKMKFVKF